MEATVFRIPIPPSTLAAILKPLLLVTVIVYGIMTYYNSYMIVAVVLVVLVFIWLQFFYGRAEFEYRLGPEGLQIDLVSRKGRRKQGRAYDWNQMLLLDRTKAPSLLEYVGKGKQIQMKDFASRKNQDLEYALICRKEQQTDLLLLELDSDMLDIFRQQIPEQCRNLL